MAAIIGGPVLISASGAVLPRPGSILGFYVSSTTSGTLVLYDNASAASGNQITGTITPAIGWHPLPLNLGKGLYATVGGTISVTFVVNG
jgi:hypothetical protein